MSHAKLVLKSWLPPVVWNVGKSMKRRVLRSDHFEYAPHGWSTPLGNRNEDYWLPVANEERQAYEQLVRCAESRSANSTPEVTVIEHLAYGYVLGLAGRGKRAIRVLDYGGNLGQHLFIGRAMMPDLAVDFHCKELPSVAQIGLSLNPSVTWHVKDACLAESYDLVMFSSSLQYVRDWKATLHQAANAAGAFLFLCDVPIVRSVNTFMATQRSHGLTNVQYILNCDEIVSCLGGSGLRVVGQFEMREHPEIMKAPEQPQRRSFLFERLGRT
jgi:putative methyltransferase (TIGR04325 family)